MGGKLCSVRDRSRRERHLLHPYAAARRPRDNAAGRLERAALALVADGWSTELQSTVVHRRLAPSVAGYAIAAITSSVVALRWPTAGAALSAAVFLGGLVDLAGGRSWVRRLTPRRGHRNVLLWADQKAPDPHPGPWPGLEPADPHQRQVLVVVPDHPQSRPSSLGTGLGAMFGLIALGSILATLLLEPAAASTALAASAVSLLFVAAVAMAIDRRPGRPRSAQGIAAARAITEALAPMPGLRVGVVIVGSLEPWFDGVEVLLQSRRRRLPPDRTDVLVWHPGHGPLSKVPHDGLFGRSAAPHLLQAARALPVAATRRLRPWRTGALRAQRLGWPALGLVGGRPDRATIDALVQVLHDLEPR